MKSFMFLKIQTLFVVLSFVYTQLSLAEPTQQRMVIYGMGGTIAGEFDDSGTGHYEPGEVDLKKLLALLPELGEIGDVVGYNVPRDWSARLSYQEHIRALAQILYEEITNDIDTPETLIVTMGTDTMAQVAFATQILLYDVIQKAPKKTLIFLGAMEPLAINDGSELNPDPNALGAHTLISAARLGASGVLAGKGINIVMGKKVMIPPAIKLNTEISDFPFAPTYYNLDVGSLNIDTHLPEGELTPKTLAPLRSNNFSFNGQFPEQVAGVIVVKQQMDSDNNDDSAESLYIQRIRSGEHNIKAIILEGTGQATSTRKGVALAEVAASAGIPVIRSSEVAHGYAYNETGQPGLGGGILRSGDLYWLLSIGLASTEQENLMQEAARLVEPYQDLDRLIEQQILWGADFKDICKHYLDPTQ